MACVGHPARWPSRRGSSKLLMAALPPTDMGTCRTARPPWVCRSEWGRRAPKAVNWLSLSTVVATPKIKLAVCESCRCSRSTRLCRCRSLGASAVDSRREAWVQRKETGRSYPWTTRARDLDLPETLGQGVGNGVPATCQWDPPSRPVARPPSNHEDQLHLGVQLRRRGGRDEVIVRPGHGVRCT